MTCCPFSSAKPVRRQWLAALFFAVSSFGLACATEDPGISPARDRFYFPTSLAMDPLRPLLYVISSNADRRNNGSTISVLDLQLIPEDPAEINQRVADGLLSCKPSIIEPATWNCPESQFIDADSTLRLGHYPGSIQVRSDGKRLFITERADGYLMWADIVELDNGHVDLRCAGDLEAGCGLDSSTNCKVWDCDADHKVDFSPAMQKQLPSEPFGLFLNELTAVHVAEDGSRHTCRDGLSQVSCTCDGAVPCQEETDRQCCLEPPGFDHLFVTHLLGGEVSYLTSEPTQVALRDFRSGFFQAVKGIGGAFNLAAKVPGDWQSPIYMCSRVSSVLASFLIRNQSRIIDSSRATVGSVSPGSDVRGLAFSPGGEVLYYAVRYPPSVGALDMTSGESELPKQDPLWAVEVCSDPTYLVLAQDPMRPHDPRAQLAYVTCFSAAQIYVIDTTLGVVINQIHTGNGPNGFVIDNQRQRAFVANFLDNTVGMIDLNPSRKSYQQMILRLGSITELIKQEQ